MHVHSLVEKLDELLDSNHVAQDVADGAQSLATRLLRQSLAQRAARAHHANVCTAGHNHDVTPRCTS